MSRLKSQEESSISDFDEQTVDGSHHAHFSFAFVHKKNLKTSFLRGGQRARYYHLVFWVFFTGQNKVVVTNLAVRGIKSISCWELFA